MEPVSKVDHTQMLDKTFIVFDKDVFSFFLRRGIESALNGKDHDGRYFALYHRTAAVDETIMEYMDIAESKGVDDGSVH